jgi:hypothetical protein
LVLAVGVRLIIFWPPRGKPAEYLPTQFIRIGTIVHLLWPSLYVVSRKLVLACRFDNPNLFPYN